MKETSLDEFVSSTDGDESEAKAEDEPTEEGPSKSLRIDPNTVEPATITSQWSPDGTPCESCGEQATRSWVDDGGRVCPDCKDWG